MTNGEIILIKEGQFLTGRKQLSEATGISETTIERVLKVLESEHQIGQQKTSKYRLITIVNWKQYQTADSTLDNKRTTNGQQTDTNKNDKNEENDKNETLPTVESVKKVDKLSFGELENVMLTPIEYEKLVSKLGETNTGILIEELSLYMGSKKTKYLSHYATLLGWAKRKYQDHQQKLQTKKRTLI